MKKLVKQRFSSAEFIDVCKSAKTMAEAASCLGLHFNSFKKRALELKCYNPNKAGIGIRKDAPRVSLTDIIEKNLYPHYQSYKLKKRLIEEGLKDNKCEHCGIPDWRNKPISMQQNE